MPKKPAKPRSDAQDAATVHAPSPLVPMPDEAMAFVLMLEAGVEPKVAASYFFDKADAIDIAAVKWREHARVREAFETLHKGPWHKLDPEARIKLALDKLYNEMAYFLWTHHYGEIWGRDQDKADRCRDVLERRLAGTAGLSPLERFWKDFTDEHKGKPTAALAALPAH